MALDQNEWLLRVGCEQVADRKTRATLETCSNMHSNAEQLQTCTIGVQTTTIRQTMGNGV